MPRPTSHENGIHQTQFPMIGGLAVSLAPHAGHRRASTLEPMPEAASRSAQDALTLFFSGDVMLGRGVDQILQHPGDPTLYEHHVRDARTYVDLAIRANGSIPQPVDWSWPWGDALELLEDAGCDARIINVETSITTSDDYVPGKAVHYRMNPANVEAVSAVRPDACVLANNHVLEEKLLRSSPHLGFGPSAPGCLFSRLARQRSFRSRGPVDGC